MKLQINTEIKTITIEEAVSFGELFDMLSAMFPKMEWRNYLLCPVEKIEVWKDPIVVPWNPAPWVVPYSPTVPYVPSYPIITCGTTNSIYNLELKSQT
jgi:hypothetical protein